MEKTIVNKDECKVTILEHFIDSETIQQLKNDCSLLPFTTKEFVCFGKKVKTPRKTCSIHFGEDNMTYKYSGIVFLSNYSIIFNNQSSISKWKTKKQKHKKRR